MSNSDGHLSGHSMPPQDHVLAKSQDLNSTVFCRTSQENNVCNFLQFPVCKEEFPEQQERSPNLVQEEAEPPHIKEEPDEWNTVLIQEEPEPPQIKDEQDEEIIQRPEEGHGSTRNNLPQEDLKNQTSSIRCIQGKKVPRCTECGKIFFENRYVKIHMRVHTGERPYACTLCDKSFFTSSHRTRHMKTHTAEKEFACVTCGEVFGNRGSLTIHTKIHTGEKPLIEHMLAKSLGT